MTTGPLDGVRVIDLTHALAGPYATMLLSDLGADVIKVEPPAGDLARRAGPYPAEDRTHSFGGYFQSVNRGKRSVVLDLKTPEGAAMLRSLAAEADVLVENFTPGVMDRLGLSYESLAADNPRLVYAALRGFGDPRSGESPYQSWPAFDVVIQAMAGIMGITGTEDGTPIKVGPGVGDIFPGALLSLGVTSALYEARGSGRGQFLDVSMYDAILSLCERIVYQHSYTGAVPGPEGNRHPLLSPFDILPATDGWVAIAAPNDNRWRRLSELIDRPDLAQDPRFATNDLRVSRRDEVYQALETWTRDRTKSEILAHLGGQVPVGAVRDVAEIMADPHVAARNMAIPLEHPGTTKKYAVAGQPLKFSRTPAIPRARAPLLDEHGQQVRATVGHPGSRVRRIGAPNPLPHEESMSTTTRTAIVTGAARGIGAAVAKRLAADGFAVAVLDLEEAACKPVVEEIETAAGRALAVGADVADEQNVQNAVERIAQELGEPTVLINNAGIIPDTPLFKMPVEDWDAVIDVHLRGSFLMTRAVQGFMTRAGWGRIVNLSSTSALGNRGQANYAAAKAGVQGFTKTLAFELGRYGVTANAIAPGFIATEMTAATAQRIGMPFEEFKTSVPAQTPAGRVGTPEDIAHAVSFFASAHSGFVSGQVLYVAGGPKA